MNTTVKIIIVIAIVLGIYFWYINQTSPEAKAKRLDEEKEKVYDIKSEQANWYARQLAKVDALVGAYPNSVQNIARPKLLGRIQELKQEIDWEVYSVEAELSRQLGSPTTYIIKWELENNMFNL